MLVGNWEDLPWDLWGPKRPRKLTNHVKIDGRCWKSISLLKWQLFRWFSMIFRGDLLGYLQLNHEHLFRFRGQVGEASASRSLPKNPNYSHWNWRNKFLKTLLLVLHLEKEKPFNLILTLNSFKQGLQQSYSSSTSPKLREKKKTCNFSATKHCAHMWSFLRPTPFSLPTKNGTDISPQNPMQGHHPSLHTEISTGMARDIWCMPSTIQSGRPGSVDLMGIHWLNGFSLGDGFLVGWFLTTTTTHIWKNMPTKVQLAHETPRINIKNIFESTTYDENTPKRGKKCLLPTQSPPESTMFWPHGRMQRGHHKRQGIDHGIWRNLKKPHLQQMHVSSQRRLVGGFELV